MTDIDPSLDQAKPAAADQDAAPSNPSAAVYDLGQTALSQPAERTELPVSAIRARVAKQVVFNALSQDISSGYYGGMPDAA